MIKIILPLVSVCWRQPGDGTYRGNDKENCSIESRVAVWPSWSMFISYKLLKLSNESDIRNNLFAPGSIFWKSLKFLLKSEKVVKFVVDYKNGHRIVLPGKIFISLVTAPLRILFCNKSSLYTWPSFRTWSTVETVQKIVLFSTFFKNLVVSPLTKN